MTTKKKAKRVSTVRKSSGRARRGKSAKGIDAAVFLEGLDGSLRFGELIASIREGEEWSQDHLGRLLGASKQHISEVERNRKTVSPERAATWARVLGYSEKLFVELALQAELERAELSYVVHLESA